MFIARLFCLVTAANILTGNLLAGENLLPNPSFEEGNGNVPAHWECRHDKLKTAFWTSEEFKEGKKSVSIGQTMGKVSCQWVTEEGIAVTPGAEYRLTGWIKVSKSWGGNMIGIAWFSKKGWFRTDRSKVVNGTHDWTFVNVQTKAPEDALFAKINAGKRFASTGTAWFDGLVFEQVGTVARGNEEGDTVFLYFADVKETSISNLEEMANFGSSKLTIWKKLNPGGAVTLAENKGILEIKDTFSKFTGWISAPLPVTSDKKISWGATVKREKSYNVYLGILWIGADSKPETLTVVPCNTNLDKWEDIAISANVPDNAKAARAVLLQRRSSGKTLMKNPRFNN